MEKSIFVDCPDLSLHPSGGMMEVKLGTATARQRIQNSEA